MKKYIATFAVITVIAMASCQNPKTTTVETTTDSTAVEVDSTKTTVEESTVTVDTTKTK
jgi:hypothetical protein